MNEKLIKLIEHFEGLRLTAYKCQAGVWTIGYGTTRYPDGEKVLDGDVITEEYARECLEFDLTAFISGVRRAVTTHINDDKRAALIDFTYNLGMWSLLKSTLLKKVNADPLDHTIQKEFEKWVLASGKKSEGLLRRRKAEAWLYFHGELKFDFLPKTIDNA